MLKIQIKIKIQIYIFRYISNIYILLKIKSHSIVILQ
jgi:hypothetical protein